MITSAQLGAFHDELLKIALDVKVIDIPGLPHGGIHKKLDSTTPPEVHALAKGRKELIGLRPRPEIRSALDAEVGTALSNSQKGLLSDATYQSMRRHELTHYMRGRKGKLEGIGKPGLRNLARTAREEGIAYHQGLKPVRKALESGAFEPALKKRLEAGTGAALGQNFMHSMNHAYPAGLRRAALSGTLKPLLPLAEKLKLVR